MTPNTCEITVRKTVPATPEQVWATWTDVEAYRAIHGVHEARIDFREGGEIEVRFRADRPARR